MGLDIALGVFILLGAIRGWFRGFLTQAIRLGGVIGSAYAAGPIRDQATPYVAPYLTSINPALLGRMLWWSSAVAAYVVMVGLASLAVKSYRKRPYGEPEPNRADQFAGFLLGAAKGGVIAAFLILGLDRYVMTYTKQLPWASEQVTGSQAVLWHEQYKPAERIWTAPPVQLFVAYVRKMGVDSDPKAPTVETKTPTTERAPIQAAENRPPRLDLPAILPLDPKAADFTKNFDEELRRLESPSARP